MPAVALGRATGVGGRGGETGSAPPTWIHVHPVCSREQRERMTSASCSTFAVAVLYACRMSHVRRRDDGAARIRPCNLVPEPRGSNAAQRTVEMMGVRENTVITPHCILPRRERARTRCGLLKGDRRRRDRLIPGAMASAMV